MRDSDILSVLQQGDKPFGTASEVAETGGISRQRAHERLQKLYNQDVIEKYKCGSSAVIWWVED